jgi:uncharacterized protein (DUF1015 family)
MTAARAFPHLRYDPDTVGDPGKLLAPPYDVITPAERTELAAQSPYQSVLLELPEGDDAAVAGEMLARWESSDVLEGDVGIALIQQRYVGPDGVRRTRTGVQCEVQLHDFAEGKVQPHEQTFEAPRKIRLELMRGTGANISPVFLLYHDPERSLADMFASVTDDEPDFTATDPDGTQTAVWFVSDVSMCDTFEQRVADFNLLIADGHHRYTAALAYRDEVRAAEPRLSVVGGREFDGPPHTSSSGADGVMAVLCNSADPGIMVFPTHRVLHGVRLQQLDEFVLGSGAFRCDVHDDAEDALFALEQLEVPGFVVHHGSRTRLFSLADPDDLKIAAPDAGVAVRSLDDTALHSLVIDGGALLGQTASKVSYTRSLDEALELVGAADDRIGFLMRSVPVERVHAVADAGELLPQKSTYFYPKVPTGVMFRKLDPLG